MKKTLLTMAVGLVVAVVSVADVVTGPGTTTFTNFPTITGTGSTATIAGYPGSPFWDNSTSDSSLGAGTKGNVGYYLQNIGDFSTGATSYLGGAGVYRSDSTVPANAPSSFTFIQGASTVSVALLFASVGKIF